MIGSRDLQQRPKDVPSQSRQGFDYFVYPEASSSTGSETSAGSSDEDSGISVSSTGAFQSTAGCTDIEAPASNSDNGVGDESAACSGEVPATAATFTREHSSKESCSASEDGGAAPHPCETKEDENCCVETGKTQQHPTATATGSLVWTPSECMLCLEPYKAGDRVCRIPCAHVFHAEVRQPPC